MYGSILRRCVEFWNIRIKIFVFLFCILILASGCNKKTVATSEKQNKENPYKITIMNRTFTNDPIKTDSPIKKAIEEYTNTQIEFLWVSSNYYSDKLNITLASADIPMVVMIPEKSSSIINATRAGAFWELDQYLKNYKNLSRANPKILNSISIDGKIYGIYRARAYGRNGVIYRKDWLANVGLEQPKTINDFYNMLKAFTEKDPDKNGENDTYGLGAAKFDDSFNIMSTWFGAPNGWGQDANGKLQPAFLTQGYFDCLKFWRKLYEEKLINQDFAVLDPNVMQDLIANGKAGVILNVVDDGHRIQSIITKANSNKADSIDVMGQINGKNLPTSGHAGFFSISKQSVKTEEDLKKVLTFLDKLNDKKMQDLINFGIEGRHYKLVDGKYADTSYKNPKNVPNEGNEIGQMSMGVVDDGNVKIKSTPLRDKEDLIQQENEKYCIFNPAESLISNTYNTKSAQLDNIISEARIKFILGQIDEAGFKARIELWKNNGGSNVIKEINDEYLKSKNK